MTFCDENVMSLIFVPVTQSKPGLGSGNFSVRNDSQIDVCTVSFFVSYALLVIFSCPFLDILHCLPRAFLDRYFSTVQGLLDWFEVDVKIAFIIAQKEIM